MKPVMQMKFGANEGNCFQACLASILELPLDDVPDFCNIYGRNGTWLYECNKWLSTRNLGLVHVVRPRSVETDYLFELPVYHIITGLNKDGIRHSVVGFRSDMVYNPNPNSGGIVDFHCYDFFVALDPSKCKGELQ